MGVRKEARARPFRGHCRLRSTAAAPPSRAGDETMPCSQRRALRPSTLSTCPLMLPSSSSLRGSLPPSLQVPAVPQRVHRHLFLRATKAGLVIGPASHPTSGSLLVRWGREGAVVKLDDSAGGHVADDGVEELEVRGLLGLVRLWSGASDLSFSDRRPPARCALLSIDHPSLTSSRVPAPDAKPPISSSLSIRPTLVHVRVSSRSRQASVRADSPDVDRPSPRASTAQSRTARRLSLTSRPARSRPSRSSKTMRQWLFSG